MKTLKNFLAFTAGFFLVVLGFSVRYYYCLKHYLKKKLRLEEEEIED